MYMKNNFTFARHPEDFSPKDLLFKFYKNPPISHPRCIRKASLKKIGLVQAINFWF